MTTELMYNIMGWAGSMLLAVCSIPQVILTLRTRKVDGLSLQMMYMWLFGCMFALVFGLHRQVPAPVICSYIVNLASCSILITCIYLWRKR